MAGKDLKINEWPKTVMGVKIKNQKEMDKLIKSMYGPSGKLGT